MKRKRQESIPKPVDPFISFLDPFLRAVYAGDSKRVTMLLDFTNLHSVDEAFSDYALLREV